MSRTVSLSRRKFLAGAGVVSGLPMLEAMLPRGPRAYAAAEPAKRFVVFHMPNGKSAAHWNWTGSLAPIKAAGLDGQVSVLRGLGNPFARGGGHTAGVMPLLSGICPASGDQLAKTMDQYIADKHMGARRRSIHLGTGHSFDWGQGRNGERGPDGSWGLRVKESISWQDKDTANAFIIDPAAAFKHVFGEGSFGGTTTPTETPKGLELEKAVLALNMEHANSLKSKLGAEDQRRLERFVSSLDDHIRLRQSGVAPTAGCSDTAIKVGSPPNHQERMRQQLDIIKLAFTCDATRVATFDFETTVNWKTHVLATGDYHKQVVHTARWEDVAKFNTFMVEHFVRLMQALQDIKEMDGSTMLDHTVILFVSELGNGSSHNHVDLPVLLGGGSKLIKTGVERDYRSEQLANLHISLMQAFGADVPMAGGQPKFGTAGTKALTEILL